MKTQCNILVLLCLTLSSLAFANDDYFSKFGFEVKGYKTTQPESGWLAGLRWGRFLGKSTAHLGLAGYYGTPTGRSPALERTWYVGGTFGYDGRLGRNSVFEAALLVGYGQGKLPTLDQKSYYVAEPSLAAGWMLGKGWRMLFSVSYLYMNNASGFSGFTFGLRFDRKTNIRIKAIDPR